MIHVCRVDVGSRHIFDSADGINDVGSLANAIESFFKIQKSNQILLISGGEVLNDYQQKLYRLSAGREESPIYLIDKTNVERETPPLNELPLDHLTQDLRQEIDAAMALRPSFQTLQTRSHLVNKIFELGKQLHNNCKSFYDDQFWQYQGFMALIANLDEFLSLTRKNDETIREQFEGYVANKESHSQLMNEIHKIIELLANIPLLPQVLYHQTNVNESQSSSGSAKPRNFLFNSFSSQSISNLAQQQSPKSPKSPETTHATAAAQIKSLQQQINADDASSRASGVGDAANSTLSPSDENSVVVVATGESVNLSLLDWIKSFDPQHQLDSVIGETRDMLANFDKNFEWPALQARKSELLKTIEQNQNMREIEGLTKRLHDLNTLLDKSKSLLAAQSDINESLMANFRRAANLRDESVLHDLCRGHEEQLEIFKTNHCNMIELTKRISRAKLELIKVIHSRLIWVMKIESQMAKVGFQIEMHYKQLKRLNVRMRLMEQIKIVPKVYLYSLKETLRRIQFSKIYKEFGAELLALVRSVYENESKQRDKFKACISSSSQHFIINILFGCLGDKVENIMNEATLKFDSNLPVLKEAEVLAIEEKIKSQLTALLSDQDVSSSSDSISSCTETGAPLSSSPDRKRQDHPVLSYLSELDYQKELDLQHDQSLDLLRKLLKYLRRCKERASGESLAESVQLATGEQDDHGDKSLKLPRKAQKYFNEAISDIKLNLSETREIVSNYKEKANENFKLLVELQKLESDKYNSHLENELKQSLEAVKSKKGDFYARLLEGVKKSFTTDNPTEIDDAELDDDLDKKFASDLLALVKARCADQQAKLDELTESVKTIKKNASAEKQIQFNEALKKTTLDRDRKIEELKRNETGYLEKIKSLEQELTKLKMSASDATMVSSVRDLTLNENPVRTGAAKASSSNVETVMAIAELSQNLDDKNLAKSKLRELMLLEKISSLEKQVASFQTIPLTNDFETIQLNSCQIDDLVIAVYSEEYGSYKIIHKSSNYLYFVHSAIFKSHEQRLSFKTGAAANESASSATTPGDISKLSCMTSTSSHFDLATSPPGNHTSTSPVVFNEDNFELIHNNSNSPNAPNRSGETDAAAASSSPPASANHLSSAQAASSLVKNSPSDNVDNIFLSEKQPQWFVGRVLVKEFCVARKENNRFRVPSGTRFYRVKLKPYNLN